MTKEKKHRLPGFVADSYLDSSKIILNQLSQYINENQSLEDVTSPYHLIYPAIFNFKNGIELWLKNLQQNIIGKADTTTHNPVVLIDSLIITIFTGDAKNKELILGYLKSARKLLMPYYDGSYLGISGKTPDRNNEAERFPEAKFPDVYCPVDSLSFQKEDKIKVNSIVTKSLKDINDFKKEVMSIFFAFNDKD
jgi:hypothetical protein